MCRCKAHTTYLVVTRQLELKLDSLLQTFEAPAQRSAPGLRTRVRLRCHTSLIFLLPTRESQGIRLWLPLDRRPSAASHCSTCSRYQHRRSPRHRRPHTQNHIYAAVRLGGRHRVQIMYSSSPESCMKSSSSDMVWRKNTSESSRVVERCCVYVKL